MKLQGLCVQMKHAKHVGVCFCFLQMNGLRKSPRWLRKYTASVCQENSCCNLPGRSITASTNTGLSNTMSHVKANTQTAALFSCEVAPMVRYTAAKVWRNPLLHHLGEYNYKSGKAVFKGVPWMVTVFSTALSCRDFKFFKQQFQLTWYSYISSPHTKYLSSNNFSDYTKTGPSTDF